MGLKREVWSERQCTMVWRMSLERLSTTVMAARLGRSEMAVKAKLHRIRKARRKSEKQLP